MQQNKLLTLLFILLGFTAWSQNSTISGTVVDAKTLKPIADAAVIIEGKEPVKSNSLGNFQMWNLPFGEYTLKVTKENHATFYQQIVLDSDYKYVRVRMGEISSVSGVSTSNVENNSEDVKIVKETIIIRDTVFIEKIVEKTNNNKQTVFKRTKYRNKLFITEL